MFIRWHCPDFFRGLATKLFCFIIASDFTEHSGLSHCPNWVAVFGLPVVQKTSQFLEVQVVKCPKTLFMENALLNVRVFVRKFAKVLN